MWENLWDRHGPILFDLIMLVLGAYFGLAYYYRPFVGIFAIDSGAAVDCAGELIGSVGCGIANCGLGVLLLILFVIILFLGAKYVQWHTDWYGRNFGGK